MARVREVTAASTWSGSRVRVPGEDVAEHRQRPGRHGRVRGGGEGQRRDDHLVAPADPEGLEGDLHGDGAVGHHHPVPGALVGGEPLGEGGGQRPRLGEPAPAAAPHHLGDRLGVAFVVHRPGRVALGPDRRPAAQRQLRHVVPPVRRRPVASRRGVDFPAPPQIMSGREEGFLTITGRRPWPSRRRRWARPACCGRSTPAPSSSGSSARGPVSRAQVARDSGLSKPTVSLGLSRPAGRRAGPRGRPVQRPPGAERRPLRAEPGGRLGGGHRRRPPAGPGRPGRHHRRRGRPPRRAGPGLERPRPHRPDRRDRPRAGRRGRHRLGPGAPRHRGQPRACSSRSGARSPWPPTCPAGAARAWWRPCGRSSGTASGSRTT